MLFKLGVMYLSQLHVKTTAQLYVKHSFHVFEAQPVFNFFVLISVNVIHTDLCDRNFPITSLKM